MEQRTENALGPFLTNSLGEKYLYPVNRDSFLKMGSEQVYADFFGRDFFKVGRLYLIVGTDSGLLVQYLQSRGIPESSRVVFLELPEVMERLPEVVDLENLDSRMAVTTLQTVDAAFEEFRLIDYIFAGRLIILKGLCVLDTFLPEYFALFQKIKADLDEAIFTTRANLGDRSFFLKQLECLAENRISSACLKGQFAGKTGVLLAVGPSLDEIIPWVKAHRDELVVIAVSRAARKLYQEGLVPHIIYTMDPTDLSFDVSRETLHFFRDTLFIHYKHATPLLSAQWRGRSLYGGPRIPWKSDLNVPTLGIAGPTITQGILQNMIEMEFSRVILGGVDLCFSREGHPYGSSVVGREKGLLLGDVSGGVETNGGWRAGTYHPYLLGGQIMAKLSRLARQKRCRIETMSAGAMKIPGIAYVPLEKLELDPQTEKAEAVLSRCVPPDDRQERRAHYRAVLEEVKRARKAAMFIRRLAEKALEANKKMFDVTASKPPEVYKGRMDRIEKRINRVAIFPKLLKTIGILRFLKIVRPNLDPSQWSDADIEKTGTLYYQAYSQTAKEFYLLLQRAEERLRCRMMEEDTHFVFDRMADQWEKDRQFGRCLVWRDRNPEGFARLTEAERARFAQLEARFERIMGLEESLSKQEIVPETDYRLLRAKAKAAFGQENVEALGILAAGQSEKDDPRAVSLKALAGGYAAELTGDLATAFLRYREVIDAGHPVFSEDALVRVASLAADNRDHASLKLAFECLAGLNPMYAPKYAELLWALGERPQALDVCAGYLKKMPGDTMMLVRLAGYYLELDAPDAAVATLGFVLEKDPEHAMARALLEQIEKGHPAPSDTACV